MIKLIIIGALVMLAFPIACSMVEHNRVYNENKIIEKCNIEDPKDRVNCIMYEAKKEELSK